MSNPKPQAGDVATNRKGRHRFEYVERFECGIALQGTEVKSARQGLVELGEAYATIDKGEVWLRQATIAPYPPASRENHEPTRARKLLLKRYEIERLIGTVQRKGLTLVPTRMYFKGPHAKVEIALARNKQAPDKRRDQRARDLDREAERAMKSRR